MREEKKKVKQRQQPPTHRLLFVDYEKAFDSVHRPLLLQKMQERKFSPYLQHIVANFLSRNTAVIG